MGIYIGIIEKKGYDPTVFFNFKPIAEIQSTQVIQLTAQEQEALLPESEKRNICFTYSWNVDNERRRMDAISLKNHSFSLSSPWRICSPTLRPMETETKPDTRFLPWKC